MTIFEAIKKLDENIPPHDNKMVDYEHLPICVAWEVVKEHLKKIESGLLVERPCKIGDKFYVVIRGLPPQEWIVDEFIETKERIVVSGWKNTKDGGFWRLFPIDDFGKKIFTTKEAAEAKLKELGGKTK